MGVNRVSRGYEPRKDGAACTIMTRGSGTNNLVTDFHSLRRLTPVECERLQAYPDGWTEWGVDETGAKVRISDTGRYRCLGNSVTVTVVHEIVKCLPTETNSDSV